jgi:hypothetical protein
MKPLFRRSYQSKTNCSCLSGEKNLCCARELGKTAWRGFLLVLDFHAPFGAALVLENFTSRRFYF